MNGFAIAALGMVGLWLGALTLVVILLVRQIGLLTVRLARPGDQFSLAADGPKVGSIIPSEVATALPELSQGRVQLVLLSATCTPCRERAAELGHRTLPPTTIALVPGPVELADGVVALLPSGLRVIRSPEAVQITDALQIKSAPFAVAVEEGTVTGKTYLHSVADFDALLEKKRSARPRAPRQLEVGHVR